MLRGDVAGERRAAARGAPGQAIGHFEVAVGPIQQPESFAQLLPDESSPCTDQKSRTSSDIVEEAPDLCGDLRRPRDCGDAGGNTQVDPANPLQEPARRGKSSLASPGSGPPGSAREKQWRTRGGGLLVLFELTGSKISKLSFYSRHAEALEAAGLRE
jgi:hypothetical protein